MTLYSVQFNGTLMGHYEEFPLLMPRWGYVASAFVLFLIGFFGFFLNLMVILIMFKDRQLWTPLNIILFNLVCSDFSVSFLGNPFTLISALFHRWIFGHSMCVLYGFFMALLGITSITTLTVISFERYMMVTRPFSSRHLTSNGAIMLVVFIWAYSLALTTPPLFGWGNYVNEAANIRTIEELWYGSFRAPEDRSTCRPRPYAVHQHSPLSRQILTLKPPLLNGDTTRSSVSCCSVNWHEQSLNTLTYILFLFAMGQILPFAVITFSYVNIIRTLKKVSPGASVIPALVAKSSICYNPLIYVGMNTQFRQSIKRIFGIHDRVTSSQTEKGCNNSVLSPCHKLSALNDNTVQYSTSAVCPLKLSERGNGSEPATGEWDGMPLKLDQ
ncbi:unnamed protein product, partial [Iphiclides podalirius]